MSRQHIQIGVIPNDGTGDTLRDGMDKANDNFIELYGTAVEPEYFYFTGRTFRMGVRGGMLCIDKTITALGFGVGSIENTDWANIHQFTL